MITLGINAVFHDSSACIFKNGKLLAAVEEERFTGIKHGKRPIPFTTYEIPFHAINYCLEQANITLSQVDNIAYSFNPYLLIPPESQNKTEGKIPFISTIDEKYRDTENPWNDLFLSSILHAPSQLVDGYPHHLQKRFRGSKETDWQWHYVDHHFAHAASAFYPSPFEQAAIMTLDGRGEIASTTYSIGQSMDISRISQVNLPNSLGLLYERLTTHLGFLHSSDEYKVMALASYGKPHYIEDFREIIQVGENGQYYISQNELSERFGPARLREDPFTTFHFDLAHSLQYVLEETALSLCDWFYKNTKVDNLCLAGGIALNCVLNAKIRDKGPFKNVWVQPAAGDAGTALGAAIMVNAKQAKNEIKQPYSFYKMEDVYLGPEYSDKEIEKFLTWAKVPYYKSDNISEDTASLLAQDQIIGWFQGRMEFGPRALGSRSILASPINAKMQARLNEVKDREDFRPVAPVILEEDAAEWFSGADTSPFMLFVNQVSPNKADKIPAVRHTDGTARIQTVNKNQHPRYYNLLKAFKEITGVPILINTSFNTLGKPIVCSPRDAIESFWTSPFDALIIGSFIISKNHDNKDIRSNTYIQSAQPLA